MRTHLTCAQLCLKWKTSRYLHPKPVAPRVPLCPPARTPQDVIAVVHIGLSTVERRVMELAEAFDAHLTVPQLEERDREAEQKRVCGVGGVGACRVL